MRHHTILLATAAAALLALMACGAPGDGPSGSVTSVVIDQPDPTLAFGEAITLSATIEATGTVERTVRWSSDDENVASVDEDGVVTTTGVGVTTVRATSTADGSVRASIEITVLESILDPSRAFTVAITPPLEATDVEADVATLAAGLAAELGRPVVVTTYPSFAGSVQAVLDRTAEVAVLGPTAVVQAIDEGDASAVLTAVRGGDIAYRGEFYARCGSTFTSLAALTGARFAFVDSGSMAGYRVPYVDLVDMGIDPDADMISDFAGSHDAVIRSIYDDDVDAGVTFEGAVSTIAGDYPDVEDVVCSIGFTTDIPNEGVVVRGGVAPSERDRVTAAWTAMLDAPETNDAVFNLLRTRSFEPAPEGSYDIIRKVIETFF